MRKTLAALVLTLATALPARADEHTDKIRINDQDHYIRNGIVHDENGFGIGHVEGTNIFINQTIISLVKDGIPEYTPTTDIPKDTTKPIFDILYAKEIQNNSFLRHLGMLELEGEEGLTITAEIITPHNTLPVHTENIHDKNNKYIIHLQQHDSETTTIHIMAVDWQGNATEKTITYLQKTIQENNNGILLRAGEQAWFDIHQQPELLQHALNTVHKLNTNTKHDAIRLDITQLDHKTGRFTPQGPNNGWYTNKKEIVIGLALFTGEYCKKRLEELITHEWAHNEYAHLTKEEKQEFTTLWRTYNDYDATTANNIIAELSRADATTHSKIFNEGTYLPHNQHLGHTEDQPTELFASATTIYKLPHIKKAFDQKIKEQPEHKQQEAQEIMNFIKKQYRIYL